MVLYLISMIVQVSVRPITAWQLLVLVYLGDHLVFRQRIFFMLPKMVMITIRVT